MFLLNQIKAYLSFNEINLVTAEAELAFLFINKARNDKIAPEEVNF